MATSKKAADPQKKLLITAIKKTINKNAILPILESVLLTGETAIVSDLETSVVIPYKTGVNVAIPADKFIDCLEMMEAPEIIQDKPTFSVTIKEGKRSVKILGENPENFPIIPLTDKDYPAFGKLTEADMEKLQNALSFVSSDDLRPAMTGVFIEEGKNGKVVGTDAHRMYFDDLSGPVSKSFILPAKGAKILLALGGEWVMSTTEEYQKKDGKIVMKRPTKKVMRTPEHFIIDGVAYRGELAAVEMDYKNRELLPPTEPIPDEYKEAFKKWAVNRSRYKIIEDIINEKEEVEVPDMKKAPEPVLLEFHNVCFTRKDGVKVVTRKIDARYPQYEVVIPRDEPATVATVNPDELLKELKNAGKFANKSTNQVTFGVNGKLTIASQDIDFAYEYNNEFELAEIKHNTGEGFKIAFNAKFLNEVVNKLKDEPIVMKLWSPTKCTIINEHYLIMPLMLNSEE